jgi:hypothetical protein
VKGFKEVVIVSCQRSGVQDKAGQLRSFKSFVDFILTVLTGT